MRNLFDQYSQPENRLTHALVSALAEDLRLLRRFVHWATRRRIPRSEQIEILEQGLPGELPRSEDEAEQRGLPDACIHNEDGWALLIESKIAAPLKVEQLRRHLRTARRRGLGEVTVLALATGSPKRSLPSQMPIRSWSEVYTWLVRESPGSEWAARAADYFVAAENRLVEEGYMTEGTLSTFAGIPFQEDEPYNYPEAKRLLKLMMEELRSRKELVRKLGVDPKGQGRTAITGKDASSVWDFLRLKAAKRDSQFTSYPHLTLVLRRDHLLAMVTVPNSTKRELRSNIVALGQDGFRDLLYRINTNLLSALRGAQGAAPWVEIVQRRYFSQRSSPIHDARLEYDLRTAFPGRQKRGGVRMQPEWLRATYESFAKKDSNLQLMVGAQFPYAQCPRTRDRTIVDYVARSWLACAPLISVLMRR